MANKRESGPEQCVPRYTGDQYEAPDWLRYARAVFFDGYSPPLYPDIDDFDARRLVEVVAELGADTLRFHPIGYWAYYPSAAFRVFPDLGDRDLIAEVSRECHRQGIHLYCYTGYSHVHMEMGWTEEHPEFADWICRNIDGTPRGSQGHYGSAQRHMVDRLGDTYRSAIRTVVKEFCEHDMEGVYFDAPSGASFYTEVCFCDSCRKNFKKFSGMDIERLADPDDLEARIAWYHWNWSVTEEDLLDFRKIIHGSGKFMLCHNGGTWHGKSLRQQYRIPEGFMVEFSTQTYQRLVHGMMGASMARPGKKLAQMYLGSYDVRDHGEPSHSTHEVVHNTNLEDGDEIRMEGLASLACGNAPIYGSANRLLYGIGTGGTEPAKEVFDLMRRCEPLVKDSMPVANISIVPSWDSLQLWQGSHTTYNLEMSEGFALAMLDEHIGFDVCPNTELDAKWLKDQKVVVLCGASGMCDAEARLLAAWVEKGGALLATWDTGLYDENGQLRADGGALRRVLGVSMKGEPLESVPDCYIRVKATHAALGEYEEGTVAMADGRNVPVQVMEGAQVLADVWDLGNGQSRGPAIVVNHYGEGKAAYISGSLESHYAVSRVPSLRRMLGAIVRWLGDDAPQPFGLSAPTGVYGVLRRAANDDLVLWILAPIGFKDAAVGRMRQEFVPVLNVEVRILVPEGRKVKAVRLLRTGQSLPFEMCCRYAVATLPWLHIAEGVHLELM